MSEYIYVRLKEGGTWHLARNEWTTLSGIQARRVKEWQTHRWPKGVRPLGRLCKRCVKSRKARER